MGFLGDIFRTLVVIAISCYKSEAGSPKKKDTLKQFHITFRLCASSFIFNRDLYQKYGYKDDEYMFVGQSRYNPQVFGWAGHKEGGGHFTTEEMLRETNVPWRDLIKSIAYGVTVIQGDDINWPLIPLYQGCVTFDPNKYFQYDHTSDSELFFTFASDMDYEISVYIEDTARPSSRMIKTKAKAQLGSDIRFGEVIGHQEVKKYLLSFSLTSRNSSWSGMKDSEFEDHEECERVRIRERLDEAGLSAVKPFWAAEEDNLADTSQSTKIDKKHILDLWSIFDGSWESGCLPGCVTTSTRVTRLAEYRTIGKHEYSTLIFTFDKDFQYTNFVE